MNVLRLLILVLIGMVGARGASWYVDPLAVGANSGTSWANAWTSFASINWTPITAGDTIYLSGGAASQTYSTVFTFQKGGTVSAPLTLRAGTDALHNGRVIFNGVNLDLNAKPYVTISGNVGGTTNWWFQNMVNTNTATYSNAILADSTTGFNLNYCFFTNVNNCIQIIQAAQFTIEHCGGTDIRGDAAVRAANSVANSYDVNFVQDCDFELSRHNGSIPHNPQYNGPDGVQGSHGITVRRCRFRIKVVSYPTSFQHPDYVQVIGNYLKVYDNEFWNIGDSAIDMDWWVNPTPHDILIFNNVFRITQDVDPFPEYIRAYSSAADTISVTNLRILNNVFADNGWNNMRLIWRGTPALSGVEIANNLFINSSPLEETSNHTGTISFTKNVFYPNSLSISYECPLNFSNCANYTPVSWIGVEPTRILGLPVFASYSYRSTGNDFHLSLSDTIAQGHGATFSTYFTTDKDGLTRVVPWDCGPYRATGATNAPGTLTFTSPGASVSESAGSISIPVSRTAGSDGIVGVHYATANDTAIAGVNYTLTSGNLSWPDADSSDMNIVVPITNVGFTGEKQFTVTLSSPTGGATLGPTTIFTVVITGSGANPILAGMSWPATNGVISAPFVATSYVVQNSSIGDPTLAGKATYTFTNTIAGGVVVQLSVDACCDGNNSVFVQFDTEPTDPTMISDILPYTSGFANRILSWRGNGTFDQNEFVPKIFNLSLGLHTLIIRGREAGTKFQQVTVMAPPGNLPPNTPTGVSPASGATGVEQFITLTGSAYSDPAASPHAASQFRVYEGSDTTLYWDSGERGAIISIAGPRLQFSKLYYYTLRYQNALGLWSDWSPYLPFTTRFGVVLNVGTLTANRMIIP